MPTRKPLPIPHHPDVVIESEKRVWAGRFPLDVIKFRHRRFDGTMSDTRTWEVWRRGQAAALLPYDPIADAVVLIEQFRFPALVAGIEPTLVELPAGLCENNEDPADTIRREMREEMNLDADRTETIGAFLLTPGGADEYCHLYAGRVTAPRADGEGIAGTVAKPPKTKTFGSASGTPRMLSKPPSPVASPIRSPRSPCSGWRASATGCNRNG
jgi:ADP-ribose pyrophosphatase